MIKKLTEPSKVSLEDIAKRTQEDQKAKLAAQYAENLRRAKIVQEGGNK